MARPKRTTILHVNILVDQKKWLREIVERFAISESAVVRIALTLLEKSGEDNSDNNYIRAAWNALSHGGLRSGDNVSVDSGG